MFTAFSHDRQHSNGQFDPLVSLPLSHGRDANNRWLLIAFAGLILTFFFVAIPKGYCQIPSSVSRALAVNAKAIDGTQIKWTLERSSELPIEQLAKILMLMPQHSKSTLFFDQEEAYSAIDDGRILVRFSFRVPNLNPPRVDAAKARNPGIADKQISADFPMTTELSFDGTHAFSGIAENGKLPTSLLVYHRDHAIDNAIEQGMTRETCDKLWRHNYWREAGFDVPANVYDYGDLRVTSSVLHAAGIPGTRFESESATLSGRRTVKVTISTDRRKHIFYLDPSLHYAVVRHEVYAEGSRLASVAIASEFQLVPGSDDVSLPSHIDVTHYQWNSLPPVPSSEPLFQSHYVLQSIDKKKLTVADFQLDYSEKPGTYVGDDRIARAGAGELVNYVVPADARDLDAAIQNAVDAKESKPHALRGSSGNR